MLVRVLSGLAVEGTDTTLRGTDLGGRRSQIALAALALERAAVSPQGHQGLLGPAPAQGQRARLQAALRDRSRHRDGRHLHGGHRDVERRLANGWTITIDGADFGGTYGEYPLSTKVAQAMIPNLG